MRDAVENPTEEVRALLLVGFFAVIVGGLIFGWIGVKAWSDSINHIRT